jgi:hypothetical protein
MLTDLLAQSVLFKKLLISLLAQSMSQRKLLIPVIHLIKVIRMKLLFPAIFLG